MRNGLGLLIALVLLAGCTTVVPGSGSAAAPVAPAAGTTVPSPGLPSPGPEDPAGPRSALAADVVPDECLLDALAFTVLLGEPVLPPEQDEVERADGERRTACYADAAGDGTPLAMINVYEPRAGTPAEFVRAGPPQARDLDGVGEAATVIDTEPGVVLQLAGARYVVTIAVLAGAPSDDAWRTAGTAALAALPA